MFKDVFLACFGLSVSLWPGVLLDHNERSWHQILVGAQRGWTAKVSAILGVTSNDERAALHQADFVSLDLFMARPATLELLLTFFASC